MLEIRCLCSILRMIFGLLSSSLLLFTVTQFSAAVCSSLPRVFIVYRRIEMILQPKSCVRTNNIKDEDNNPKNHTENIAH